MKTVRSYGILIGVILLLAAGCSNEKQLLRQRVAAQADSLSQFKGRLQENIDSLQSSRTQVDQCKVELDSIAKESETLGHQIRQLNTQVKRLKTDNASLQESLDKSLALRDSISNYYSNVFADTMKVMGGIRSELSLSHLTIAQRDSLLGQIRPWYMKWKHDATKRNFLKVLFGSGKAKSPEIPEPQF